MMKYALYTKDLGLKIKPTKTQEMWNLERITDSEYSEDKDTHISVYGYII
jgi:hypothetical protein